MTDIFISYVEEDSAIALESARCLEVHGYTTWYFERDSYPGLDYLYQVERAIGGSSAVLVLISPASIGSEQVGDEVKWAREQRKPFIPVLKGISWAEFQNRRPKWGMALGIAAAVRIPAEGISSIIPRIVRGLEELGLKPITTQDAGRARPERFSSEEPGPPQRDVSARSETVRLTSQRAEVAPRNPQQADGEGEIFPKLGPDLVGKVSLVSIGATVSRAGNRYRYQIRIEADNQSSYTLGWSGVTINVPTIDSPQCLRETEIQMSSRGCAAPFRRGPGDELMGFLDDGSFGRKAATCLFMEAARERWPPQERIALEAVLLSSYSRLDLQVRVWSNPPENDGGFGDPDWRRAKQMDQQGIPAYPLSLGFD